jgi:hypothetical protein
MWCSLVKRLANDTGLLGPPVPRRSKLLGDSPLTGEVPNGVNAAPLRLGCPDAVGVPPPAGPNGEKIRLVGVADADSPSESLNPVVGLRS